MFCKCTWQPGWYSPINIQPTVILKLLFGNDTAIHFINKVEVIFWIDASIAGLEKLSWPLLVLLKQFLTKHHGGILSVMLAQIYLLCHVNCLQRPLLWPSHPKISVSVSRSAQKQISYIQVLRICSESEEVLLFPRTPMLVKGQIFCNLAGRFWVWLPEHLKNTDCCVVIV